MVNTHEIDLSADEFDRLRKNSYIIMRLNDVEREDLFYSVRLIQIYLP